MNVKRALQGWNPGSILHVKSLKELFIYFAQRMTRMWANYGVQMSTGRWYLSCFPVFCFTGKGGVTASCRKLKPDTLDVKWVFSMLRVINSWNNRRGNLVDSPRLELLIKAQRTWRKANASIAMLLSLDFLYNQWRHETVLQGESEREPDLLPASAGHRAFAEKSALFSSTLWYNSIENAFYFQDAWRAQSSGSQADVGGQTKSLEHPLLL